MPKHPLHHEIGNAIRSDWGNPNDLWYYDPACGGNMNLQLFVGDVRDSRSRLCCVDLLMVRDNRVRAIVEIEESGFLPTKVCGKYLQAALCRALLHETIPDRRIPYGEEVAFVHILDCHKLQDKSRKQEQSKFIEERIQALLPQVKGITKYSLIYVKGALDHTGIQAAVRNIRDVVA